MTSSPVRQHDLQVQRVWWNFWSFSYLFNKEYRAIFHVPFQRGQLRGFHDHMIDFVNLESALSVVLTSQCGCRCLFAHAAEAVWKLILCPMIACPTNRGNLDGLLLSLIHQFASYYACYPIFQMVKDIDIQRREGTAHIGQENDADNIGGTVECRGLIKVCILGH